MVVRTFQILTLWLEIRTPNRPSSTFIGRKNNRGNKTYQSRLTRWVDRLLPFQFTVQHVPGKILGLADYFSRYPIYPAPQPLESDKNYVVNLINTFKHILKNAQRISSNQNAPKLHHAYHDATKARKQNKQSKHASCHSRYLKQSLSCNHSNSSLHNLSQYNQNSRSLKNTFYFALETTQIYIHLINQSTNVTALKG